MIQAQRYKFLDQETNLPVTDFVNSIGSDILNFNKTLEGDMQKNISSLIANATQNLNTNLSAVNIPSLSSLGLDKLSLDGLGLGNLGLDKLNLNSFGLDNLGIDDSMLSKIGDSFRSVKALNSTLRNIKNLSASDLEQQVGNLFPDDPATQAAFKSLAYKCKTSSFKAAKIGKPFDPAISCNGGGKKKTSEKGCKAESYGDLLNKITGGEYKATYNNANQALNTLVNLANLGYDMNLCGVFNALSGGKDRLLLVKAGGAILQALADKGNMNGYMDLSKSVQGLDIGAVAPGAVTQALSNHSLPPEVRQKDYSDYSDRLTGATEMYDTAWSRSKLDNIYSVSIFGKKDMSLWNAMSSKAISVPVSEDDLDVVPSGPDQLLSIGYASMSMSNDVLFT
jgi:hypothetical protein